MEKRELIPWNGLSLDEVRNTKGLLTFQFEDPHGYMRPTLESGDLVAVDLDDKEVPEGIGEIFLLDKPQDGFPFTVTRVTKDPPPLKSLCCIRDALRWKAETIDLRKEPNVVLGRMIGLIRKFNKKGGERDGKGKGKDRRGERDGKKDGWS